AQHLHQRPLAAAVLAHQRQPLARGERERHVFERQHADEALADAPHREQGGGGARCHFLISASRRWKSATLAEVITSTPVSTTLLGGMACLAASPPVASWCIHLLDW